MSTEKQIESKFKSTKDLANNRFNDFLLLGNKSLSGIFYKITLSYMKRKNTFKKLQTSAVIRVTSVLKFLHCSAKGHN